jgi:divalent metal cation (Fe/Co/Zn/Cd) transporter
VSLLLPVLSLLGIETKALMEDAKRKALVYGTMAGFLLVCAIFLLVAAFIALAMWIGPLWAALALAGGALVIALAILAGYRLAAGKAAHEQAERQRSGETRALLATTAITALPMLMRSSLVRRYGLPVGAALVALYIFTRNGADAGPPED